MEIGFTEKQLAIQAVNNSGETVYTVPSDTKTIVKDIQMCNNSSVSACEVCIWFVPSGDSAGDENCLIKDFDVPAADFVHWSGFQILETSGDTIQAKAETTDKITVIISGAEIT